ncbi:TfuA-like core domain-containing protein [Rhizobium sp. XQZ8]|uniref:TfuA-like protein n=1 Tax=Rhizobium populisoli TaxID=2859785 RepID=UPI001CA4DF5F|nr:TfuA-like protein [Rhizobium populisoli]MBW6425003.1 TfuA-like core domain-containing protein [Rhizobium populisoli]
MGAVVFAGPSIFGLDLAAFPDVEFLPPAAAGDIFAAIQRGAATIGLIDGLYGDRAAVWHKELLHALSGGIPVVGAASMGALRAAECEPFGMIGVGEVFQAYRDGTRTSDADVAIVHAPVDLNYRPLTVALVDAEATIGSMGDLSSDDSDRLLNVARRQHFSNRTWRSIVTEAGLAPEFAKTLADNVVSLKRNDALQMLKALQAGDLDRTPRPQWKFQNTLFFQSLVARSRG